MNNVSNTVHAVNKPNPSPGYRLPTDRRANWRSWATQDLTHVATSIYKCIHANQASAHINNFSVELHDHSWNISEEDEELLKLEREGYGPGSQVELCTAQAVRVWPSGSASMVNVRRGGGGYRSLGLRSSSSVWDVGSLPDLSSARAVLIRSDDERLRKEAVGTKGGAVRERREKAELVPMAAADKGLRRALKKRISVQRFNFQGGGVRELVRSIGF